MKKLVSLVGIVGLLALSAAGCGSDGNGNGTIGAANNRGAGGAAGGLGGTPGVGNSGGQCNEQMGKDLQTLFAAFQNQGHGTSAAEAVSLLNQMKAQIQAFRDKYAGVVCSGTDPQTGETVSFNVDAQTSAWIQQIDHELAQINGGHHGHEFDTVSIDEVFPANFAEQYAAFTF